MISAQHLDSTRLAPGAWLRKMVVRLCSSLVHAPRRVVDMPRLRTDLHLRRRKKLDTKKFPDYTREEMLETLMSCYSALVGIYRLTKPEEVDILAYHDISDSLPRFQEIYELAKEPLDEMFERRQNAYS